MDPADEMEASYGERGIPNAEIVFTDDEMRGQILDRRFTLKLFRAFLLANYFRKPSQTGERYLRLFAVERNDISLLSSTAGFKKSCLYSLRNTRVARDSK